MQLIDCLSPHTTLEKVPVDEFLQDINLKALLSALLEPGVEKLVVLRDERSLWFKREVTGLDKVPCHL